MADDLPILPPDKGTSLREAIRRWDDLWHGRYVYPTKTGQVVRTVDSAPGYSRSFARLISGLFQRQQPAYEEDYAVEGSRQPPLDENELAELLADITSKGAGYGQVLVRPVFDGVRWVASIVAPSRYAVEWAHRRAVQIIVWDYARDPRRVDDDRAGLAFIETWTPGEGDRPGTVATRVFETSTAETGQTELASEISVESPPAGLEDHPFVVSAKNDATPRDQVVFVWSWEDLGPVSLWYTNEGIIDGLARLWDQEQDDAEMTRRRVAMPKDLVGTSQVLADGTQQVLATPGFNKHDNILLLSAGMSAQHGSDGGVTPIEFDDDLTQRDRIERRENSLLENVGINPASIGRNVGGRSDSAAAKRADNQMTMNTITAPARNVERVLTLTMRELARLGAPVAGQKWTVSVSEGLKENPTESAEMARALRDAEAASTKTLVETAHPTWSETEVAAEVELMGGEGLALSPVE